MLHRNPLLFLSSTDKGSFKITSNFSSSFFIFLILYFIIHFHFHYGNAMQEASKIRLFLMMKKVFFMLCEIDENSIFKGGQC